MLMSSNRLPHTILPVLLLFIVGAACVPWSVDALTVNRENSRIVAIVAPYFTPGQGRTNFPDMSHSDQVVTIGLLRKKAGSGSKLLFFEISRSGQLMPIDSSEDIDVQLRSYALALGEIARVKRVIIEAMDPDRTPQWAIRKPEQKAKSGSGNQAGPIVNSSEYDVDCVSLYKFEMNGDQMVYHAACCLILSPTARRTQ